MSDKNNMRGNGALGRVGPAKGLEQLYLLSPAGEKVLCIGRKQIFPQFDV